jgi:hypothetical protein
MGKRPILSAFCVGWAMLLSTSSWAATVEPSDGVLLLNKGKGFKVFKHQVAAKAGDAIMVSPDGHAKLVYADGCKVDIQPGVVTRVARLSPCASGSLAQDPDYGNHWCVTPATPTDYNNPSYCAGVPVTGAVLALFGALTYVAISP